MGKREWIKIGDARKGTEFGHVPGHQYHDVEVTISQSGEALRVTVLETWGSAQDGDKEHGRNSVVAIDGDLATAVIIATARAHDAGIRKEYLIQALSIAQANAFDALS